MGMNGNRIGRIGAGRLLAVLWILLAALAMQFVASAQIISSRLSLTQSGGNFTSGDPDTQDTAFSRQTTRGLVAADLRFVADRGDGKASPGGVGPGLLPSPVLASAPAYGGISLRAAKYRAIIMAPSGRVRVRGPPRHQV